MQVNQNMIQEFPILERKTLDDEVLEILEKLWKQKNSCQLELSDVYLRNQQLESVISNLKNTGSSLQKTIQSLQDENHQLVNQLSATVNEQRELKKVWLAEKADLNNRYFQIQSLNTQLNGTLIKKDKDFTKLQNQLSKMLSDKEKSCKSTMMISKKLPMAGTKVKSADLLSVEATAAKNRETFLRKEHERLTNELQSLRQESENSIKELMQKINVLQQVPRTMQVVPPPPPEFHSPVAVRTPAAARVNPSNSNFRPGSIANKYLKGTPKAKSVSEVMKSLEAEDNEDHNDEASSAEIQSLKAQLKEAFAVIKEQDRLIHEALISSNSNQQLFFEEDNDCEDLYLTRGKENATLNEVVETVRNSELLPAASPATISLLQSMGWESLPRMKSEFKTAGTNQFNSVNAGIAAEQLEF